MKRNSTLRWELKWLIVNASIILFMYVGIYAINNVIVTSQHRFFECYTFPTIFFCDSPYLCIIIRLINIIKLPSDTLHCSFHSNKQLRNYEI